MKLCILILKDEQSLERLVRELEISLIKDITILNSNSVVESKITKKTRAFSSIRHMLNFVYDESRVILIPTEDEQVGTIKEIVKLMYKKNQCTFFSMSIDE